MALKQIQFGLELGAVGFPGHPAAGVWHLRQIVAALNAPQKMDGNSS